MKKLIALLLAACLALLLFGCGKDTQKALQPGSYTGKGTGHGGAIEIQLTVDDAGRIANVKVLSENESPDYAAQVLALLPTQIVEKQSLGVDAVSGATLSSHGILDAVADAIFQAGGDPKDYGFVSASERSDQTGIVFEGLSGEAFTLTVAALKNDYALTELDALSISSKGEEKTRRMKGVLLEAILQKHGVSQKDFASVTAEASDGYSITIPDSILQTRDVLIAFESDGEAIDPRVVVPEERAMYWTKFVSRIRFESQAQPKDVTREVSLGELIDRLKVQAEDYKYYDADCKALPIALLLREIGAEQTDTVLIKSDDGLTKTERYSVFAAQLLVFQGTPDAPLFIGPDLPVGMRVKNVASFQVGGILVGK